MKNHGIYSLTARHNSKYGVVFFVNINPYYTKTEEVTSYVLFLTLKIRVSTRKDEKHKPYVKLFLTLKIRVSTRASTESSKTSSLFLTLKIRVSTSVCSREETLRTVSYLKNKGKYKTNLANVTLTTTVSYLKNKGKYKKASMEL